MRDRTLSLQTEFQIQNLIYISWNPHELATGGLKLNLKETSLKQLPYTAAHSQPNNTDQTGQENRSDRRACTCPRDTGQTGPPDRSDRSRQNRWAEHSALECATRQTPNLRVSLHDLPPLCIPADELDATGAEVDVLGS